MRLAMSRQRPDRVPTMPQICHPHAIRLLCEDYRKGIAETIEFPGRQHELLLETARHYRVDGLRLFALSDPLRVHDDGDEMIAVDPKTDRRVGRVDLLGGGHVIRDEPTVVVESLEDVDRIPRARCDELLKGEMFGRLRAATACLDETRPISPRGEGEGRFARPLTDAVRAIALLVDRRVVVDEAEIAPAAIARQHHAVRARIDQVRREEHGLAVAVMRGPIAVAHRDGA